MVVKPMAGQERITDAEQATETGQGLQDPLARLRAEASIRVVGPRRRRNRVAVLAQTLESDIIPRLLMAHRKLAPAAYIDSSAEADLQPGDIGVITGLAMQADLTGALSYLEGLRGRGIPIERIYLELLAPVARRLGKMWEDDTCDFTAVTIGLSCLHQIVREYSPAFTTRAPRAEPERRILLATAPAEQHSFGVLVVEQFFRGAGWDVWSGAGLERSDILEAAHRIWFGVAGFSLACEDHVGSLATLIRDVRRASRNPGLGILVGGPVFIENPQLVALVGADATAADGRQATLQAETMLALLGRDA